MENQKINKSYYQSTKATVLGVLLILFGGLYFLHQAGLIEHNVWHVIFSWQMLLIALGLLGLAERNYAWGTTLIVIGGLFLYKRATGTAIDYFWPVIIIFAGLAILFIRPRHWSRGDWGKERFKQGNIQGDFLNETAIFGGNERIVRSDNFKGGVVVSVFGGSKIDLTQCNVSTEGPVIIEMTSIFGGSNLILPTDWNVKVEVTSILGGFSDKRFHANVDLTKVVIIKGLCLFGGGEIR